MAILKVDFKFTVEKQDQILDDLLKDRLKSCTFCKGTGKQAWHWFGDNKIMTCTWCNGGGVRCAYCFCIESECGCGSSND